MRIRELLENNSFREEDYINERDEIDFDLAEDIVFFMNNDDDSYRRHVYPAIVKCLHTFERKQNPNPALFKLAALESYKNYVRKFPIRQLPDSLDDKILKEVCRKLYNEVEKHTKEGKFKD